MIPKCPLLPVHEPVAIATGILLVLAGICHSGWEALPGPESGNVSVLATTGSAVLAGSRYNGIYRSIDTGKTWTHVGPGSLNIPALATKGAFALAGIADGRVMISRDSGRNWNWTATGVPGRQVLAAAVVDSALLLGTDSGIYVSADTGATWTVATGTSSRRVTCFAVLGGSVLAGHGNANGLSASMTRNDHPGNPGSWRTIGSDFRPNIQGMTVAGTHLYASAVAVDWSGVGIFRSDDSGATWTKMPVPVVRTFGMAAVVDTASNGGYDIFYSTEAGVSVILDGQDGRWPTSSLAGSKSVSLPSPNGSSIVLVGWTLVVGTNAPASGGTGPYRCDPKKSRWGWMESSSCAQSRSGFGQGYIESVAVSDGVVFACMNGGTLLRSKDTGTTWDSVGRFDGPVRMLAPVGPVSASAPRPVVAITDASIYLRYWSSPSWLLVSTLGSSESTNLALAANDSGYFVGTSSGAIEYGVTSTTLLAQKGTPRFHRAGAMVWKGSDIYVGSDSGVFVSHNGGGTWTAFNDGMGKVLVRALCVHGGDLYASTVHGLYLAQEGSTGWVRQGMNLGDSGIRLLASAGGSVYGASFYKVYSVSGREDKWSEVDSGFNSGLEINGLVGDGSTLYLSTLGAGIWKTEVVKSPVSVHGRVSPSTAPRIRRSSTDPSVVEFDLRGEGNVEVSVFSAAGSRSTVLLSGRLPAGTHRVSLMNLPGSGLRFVRVFSGEGAATLKVAQVH